MTTINLRYGTNPNQRTARLVMDGDPGPLRVLNGAPGFINILDAMAAWQVAKELREATGLPGASSVKHVSPAGAAIGRPLSDVLREVYMVGEADLSPLASAYARARGADRLSSFGDMIGLSDVCDVSTANLIRPEVSDGIIAPGYEPEAREILEAKKKGAYLILEIDPSYDPGERLEARDLYGMRLEQDRNTAKVTEELLAKIVTKRNDLTEEAKQDLLVATVALKYTQSNSVVAAYDGQVIGAGAGQQSRVHCVRLALSKADKWMLTQCPRVRGLKFREGLKRPEKMNVIDTFLLWDELSEPEIEELNSKLQEAASPLTADERRDWLDRFRGVALSSDAYFPFRDNIDRASRSGVQFILQPGGSIRDQDVIDAADSYGMTMAFSGVRWFTH